MFGIGDKKEDFKAGRTGAREKIAKAQAAMGRGPLAEKARARKKTPPAVTIALIYGMSVAIAYMLTVGPINHGRMVNVHIGSPSLEFFLFSSGSISFTGNASADLTFRVLLRGLFIFLVAGFFPFLSLFWYRLLDNQNANPYRIFWAMPVGFSMIVIFIGLYMGDFVDSIAAIF